MAVRLCTNELEKPEGAQMSSRQVQCLIQEKYGDVGPRFWTIQRYATEGLVNVSPKKMEPSGTISEGTYKLLCEAFSSHISIKKDVIALRGRVLTTRPPDKIQPNLAEAAMLMVC